MDASEKWRRECLLATVIVWTGSASAGAAVQYDIVTFNNGTPNAVDGGVAAGASVPGAAVWPRPSQIISLHPGPNASPNADPMGYSISTAYGISGSQVVGEGDSNTEGQRHALLWTSFSPACTVDLNPGKGYVSVAYAVSGNQQVGTVNGNIASLWTGSAASWVNLGGGQALGVSDGTQVGWAGPLTGSHAALWHGTAASMVDLHPAGFFATSALGISNGQIVGVGYFSHFNHALLWTGATASSVVDLNGQNLSSSALATNGVQQVGYVSNQVPPHGGNPTDRHAVVWTGTAASVEALPVPSNYTLPNLVATAIDSDGDIIGNEAYVMWIPHRVAGDANFDGTVGFDDLLILARNYGRSGDVGFVNGDFDMDRKVDFNDLVILARNYGQVPTSSQLAQFDPAFQSDVKRAFADVPEPSGVAGLCLAIASLLRRRRPGC